MTLHAQAVASPPSIDDIAPMCGQNIICFAKDWSETPTSNNHVMVELSRHNKVLWLNSIATRAPKLGSARDLRKILRKLGSFLRGEKQVGEKMWVYTPVVLPLPHSRLAARLNRRLLKWMLGRIRRRLDMREFQLWTFLPNAAEYVGQLGESLVVYYCVDEWSKFTYLHGEKSAAAERKLLERADIVFATAQTLVDDRLPVNRNTHLARHGVDHALFAAALREETQAPSDLANIPRPILGFYGTLQDWIDFDLICWLAERRPQWSIVLIGNALVDVSRLAKYPNIHLLGRKEHATLPNYCKGFDVGIIPYIVNDRIMHVNPIKLREFLSAGLPVVSTKFPEVELYPEFCAAAANFEEFESAVEAALTENSPEQKRRRSDAMAGETWERRVAQVGRLVMQTLAAKGAA